MASSTNKKQDTDTRLNYKILILIAAASIGFHISLNMGIDDPDKFDIADVIYTVGSLASATSAFLVSRRYRKSEVFGKAYFFLGLGFSLWFVGDLIYFYYSYVLEIDPYPSLADIFYFTLYLPMIAHLIINTKYFKRKLNISQKILLISIPILIVGIFSYMNFVQIGEANFDYYYGLIFVTASAVTVAFAVLGASVFRHSILGTVWLLLAIGIFMVTLSDVWYYYTETFGVWDITHPTTTLYVTSYMVIVYALYKHQRIF